MAENNVDVKELEAEQVEQEPEDNSGNEDENPNADQDAEGELVITFGEESPPPDEEENFELSPEANMAFAKMRAEKKELERKQRETERKARELEQRLASQSAPQEVVTALGEEPTLEGCEYDTDRFKQELKDYLARKNAVDQEVEKQKEAQKAAAQAWNDRISHYEQAKAKLGVKDFNDAESVVTDMFDQTQIGIIKWAADNPEQLVYALGKNPAKAKELASIKDPVKYAVAIGKLEPQLKMTQRKAAPAPERTIRGSSTAVSTRDPKLERLEAEADKSGDRSALVAYKKQLKLKGKA